MSIVVTVQPTVEPVSVDEFKAHARIDLPDEDTVLEGYLLAARTWVEEYLWRALITQTIVQRMNSFPGSYIIDLERGPALSVTSIVYLDDLEASTTFDNTLYTLDPVPLNQRIILDWAEGSWPTTFGHYNDVTITYVAGYGATPELVPPRIRLAIMVLAAHWELNRGDLESIPMGVKHMLSDYRAFQFR